MRQQSPLSVLAALALAGGANAGETRRTPVVVAVERTAPAVVNIATEQLVTRREDPKSASDPLFEEFFRSFGEARLEERYELASLGSGTIVDARGYVLTNEHVVERASRIKVVLADKREMEASVVGTDPASDLAVLKIKSEAKLPVAALGTSSDLRIGETMIVIGNPFGLTHSVSVGVLSAASRSVRAGERRFGDFLQTDASINPGNSGGPILNLDGEVVGIATAIYSSGHGIGFAIPIDRARRVLESILQHGAAQPQWIGLITEPVGAAVSRSLALFPGEGLVVTHVVEAGPAADAGMRKGDILVRVGGGPVGASVELDTQLARTALDERIRLEFYRDGRKQSVSCKPLKPDSPNLSRIAEATLGLRVAPRREGGPGLLITDVLADGRAARRGIQAGDILYEMDGTRLSNKESFRDAFYRALVKRRAMLLVQHEEAAFYAPLALE